MNNFKNLKELYQALLDGNTIVCTSSGNMAKMVSDDLIEIKNNSKVIGIVKLGESSLINPHLWSIYQEPEKWFRATAHNKEEKRPTVYLYLYKSEEDFLKFHAAKKEDYHWIILEEVKL